MASKKKKSRKNENTKSNNKKSYEGNNNGTFNIVKNDKEKKKNNIKDVEVNDIKIKKKDDIEKNIIDLKIDNKIRNTSNEFNYEIINESNDFNNTNEINKFECIENINKFKNNKKMEFTKNIKQNNKQDIKNYIEEKNNKIIDYSKSEIDYNDLESEENIEILRSDVNNDFFKTDVNYNFNIKYKNENEEEKEKSDFLNKEIFLEKEFNDTNNDFEVVKNSFSEFIKKQSLTHLERKQSIISLNDFHYNKNEINENCNDSNNENIKVSLNDFYVKSVIGAGGYGKVYLVSHKETNKLYAMKVLKKASLVLHFKDAEHTKTERQILEEVRHPFIVDLYYAFQTNERLFLILTFACGGELFSYLQKEKMFDEDTTRFYLSEIFLALDHLHSLGIIYRDLKPENVLLDHEGHILLTDFGLSKVSLETKTLCGSLEYMAPEIILTEISYDRSVDYWSFGIMCHDLLTGKTPFNGNNRKKVMEAILKKKLTLPNYLTVSAKDLIIRLLRKNPAIRLGSKNGAQEVKNHIFFRKIDWNKVYNKETIPPIIPNINNLDDLSNFNNQFTEMSTDSIMIDNMGSKNENNINNSKYNLFRGFSFVADHII